MDLKNTDSQGEIEQEGEKTFKSSADTRKYITIFQIM